MIWFWTNMLLAFVNAYYALSGNTPYPRLAAFAFGICFAAAMYSLHLFLTAGVTNG